MSIWSVTKGNVWHISGSGVMSLVMLEHKKRILMDFGGILGHLFGKISQMLSNVGYFLSPDSQWCPILVIFSTTMTISTTQISKILVRLLWVTLFFGVGFSHVSQGNETDSIGFVIVENHIGEFHIITFRSNSKFVEKWSKFCAKKATCVTWKSVILPLFKKPYTFDFADYFLTTFSKTACKSVQNCDLYCVRKDHIFPRFCDLGPE